LSAQQANFKQRYGAWAVVAGASEGVGASASELIAKRGRNLLLVAREADRLNGFADDIRKRHGVEVRTLSQDLTKPDAADRIVAALDGLELGLIFYNAGAVRNSDMFLDQPLDLPMRMIALNCTTPTALIHKLTPAMVKRGRGGVIVVGSMGAMCGAPHIAAYSAAKAYQVNLMEGLWAEIHEQGVDVLEAVIGSTSTPGRARGLGVKFNPDVDMTPDEVAAEIFENIGNGPMRVIAKVDTAGAGPLVKPWTEFHHYAVNHMIAAVKEFNNRFNPPSS
jgi:short-subunit dehydrogenase